MSTNDQRVGFIGTGIMGAPMAENLLEAGYSLVLSSHYKSPPHSLICSDTTVLASPKAVAEHSDIVITCLPNTPHVETVLFSDNGLISGLNDNKLFIDMSSIDPIQTRAFASRVEAVGAHYLDAPVSGGEVGAIEGNLSIMVGGHKEQFERALPLFETLGKNITHVGQHGDGQTCKVANQIIVALTIEAVSEALVFASKAGADPAVVRTALMGGFASSKVLDIHGKRMIDGTFQPGFKIALHQKDLSLALDGAKKLGVNLPNTATVQQLFNTCCSEGGEEWDHSALIKSIEKLSNHSVRENH